jgi:hypothetical protein
MNLDITREINYFSHTIDGSFPMMDSTPKLGSAVTNYVGIPTRVVIHGLREKENSVDLDNNGFELLKYDGDIHDPFEDNSEEQHLYYEDISTILKNHRKTNKS